MRAAQQVKARRPANASSRVAPLATAIVTAIVDFEGQEALIRRLADPLWFQALSAVLVGDVDDGRVTLRALGALWRGLEASTRDLGLAIHWGFSQLDGPTVRSLTAACERLGRAPEPVLHIARIAARVDQLAMLDGYDLTLQAVVLSSDDGWLILDQGRSDVTGRPRRYHWLGRRTPRCIDAPQGAIACDVRRPTTDLTAPSSEATRSAILELSRMTPRVFDATAHDAASSRGSASVGIAPANVTAFQRRFAQFEPRTFDDVLLADGVGPAEMEVLVGLAELLFGVTPCTDDPATHGFTLGQIYGEDGQKRGNQRLSRATDELARAVAMAETSTRLREDALRRLERFASRVRDGQLSTDDTNQKKKQLTFDF